MIVSQFQSASGLRNLTFSAWARRTNGRDHWKFPASSEVSAPDAVFAVEYTPGDLAHFV